VSHRRTPPGQQLDFVIAQMHAVGQQCFGAKQPQAVEILDGCLPVPLHNSRHLGAGFGGVGHKQQVELLLHLPRFFQQMGGNSVRGVNLHTTFNQGIVLIASQKITGRRFPLGGLNSIGADKIHKTGAVHQPKPDLASQIGGFNSLPVHIRGGGGAALDHFDKGQRRANPHIFGSGISVFNLQDFFQPRLQVNVIGKAAEQSHCGVGVGVDQPRHNDLTGRVQRALGRHLGLDFGSRANKHNLRAVNRHRAIIKNLAG